MQLSLLPGAAMPARVLAVHELPCLAGTVYQAQRVTPRIAKGKCAIMPRSEWLQMGSTLELNQQGVATHPLPHP